MTSNDDGDGEGPASLEEEYDDYLALSDVEIGTNNTATGNGGLDHNGEEVSTRPFGSVHKSPLKFKSPQRDVFIPGVEIELAFTSYERSVTTHILNPNLYTIELRHGDFRWTLQKRYKHIQHLHQQLSLFRASLNLPFPTKSHRERRLSFKNETMKNKGKSKRNLPRFPSRPDALVPYEKVGHRMEQLQNYLRNLLRINLYRNHHETAVFLEVSELSFVNELGCKGKEGMILKRTRSAHPGSTGCNLCGVFDSGLCVRCNYVCSDICGSWRTRWLVVKDSFVAYIRPKDGRVKAVMLFDSGFEISSGILSTGYRNGLHIVNLSRQIVLKCPTRRITQEWLSFIKDLLHREGLDFTQRNRYFSFTPVRTLVSAAWLVDGRSYMAAVASALEQAKEEIYIADWWLSPEIHMRRPASESDYFRLDKILHRKAAAGVKIFLLLYKEVELALGINSFYSKQTIVGEYSENIKVLRHPDHAKAGVFLWAHHEKLVVVDQSIAFVGGIDLCYGRWDDHKHRLSDLGSPAMAEMPSVASLAAATNSLSAPIMGMAPSLEKDEKCNGGCNDYCEDFMLQPSPENMKCDTPELERRSILTTPIWDAYDPSGVLNLRGFQQRMRTRGREWMNMLSLSYEEDKEDEENLGEDEIDAAKREREVSSMATEEICLTSDESCEEIEKTIGPDVTTSSKIWLGKDYVNFIVKDFNNLDQPFQDLVDRNSTPRMPWHDIGAMVKGAAARDLARHFIQRWNAVKLEKSKLNPSYPYLIPKDYKTFTTDFEIPDVNEIKVSCQVVRSVSHWSAGFLDQDSWEGSIHEAYVDAIAKANHYVYIENQFFISLASLQVKNQVADAIYKRVVRAYKEGTTFRVYVVLPLLPGFEGELGTPSGTALHAITHWNFASISRGKDSLLVRLKEAGIKDPSEFITFHGLRTHSTLNNNPITELIYVHSKLLIADDRLVICGSANINDRSLLGKRDSEIAVVIEDEEFKPGEMNGEAFNSGKFCGSLRRYLFREHLGLLNCQSRISVVDPVASSFYNDVWRLTARNNTDIYEEVFHCIPSDQTRDFAGLKKYCQEPSLCYTDPDAARSLLLGVQGHLVTLPLMFLCDETLTPNPGSVEGMLPTSLWT